MNTYSGLGYYSETSSCLIPASMNTYSGLGYYSEISYPNTLQNILGYIGIRGGTSETLLSERLDFENFKETGAFPESLAQIVRKLIFPITTRTGTIDIYDPQATSSIVRQRQEDVFIILHSGARTTPESLLALSIRQFPQIISVLVRREVNIIHVRMSLDIDRYDFDLMEAIYETVEFPLRDEFSGWIFDVQYLFSGVDSEGEVRTEEDEYLIYQR